MHIYKEEDFPGMSDINYIRPAQIPIRADRFEYLTQKYDPEPWNCLWLMFHHEGHFLIYDLETKSCIFDATYKMVDRKEADPSDEIVAVITEIKISRDKLYHDIIENDLEVFTDLIENVI